LQIVQMIKLAWIWALLERAGSLIGMGHGFRNFTFWVCAVLHALCLALIFIFFGELVLKYQKFELRYVQGGCSAQALRSGLPVSGGWTKRFPISAGRQEAMDPERFARRVNDGRG